ncbi:atlastin-like [Sitodiplosis mosellana]|uniref:atlastin-like n=1 Tax=Sitodiplosis mosellana TaxID=263140 RepID=UPI002445267A|nr:atlastin-like [Sitodiplosis mosellana]
MKFVCTFVIFVSIFCLNVSAEEQNIGQAIQIMAPVNHTFQLQVNELKQILEVANIKDRYVVVVSIAGAFRQGKSFLMNFFIKYLDAQYKKHNASDWLGETTNNSRLNGFKWRGGRKPETIGIWMWSDIFTHDFPNGDKIAIILLDTQGIFDYRSSVHDCTAIFALSMMLSSVQCYNLMHNIREDDLQHLQLFTEYERLAIEQMNEKPFQKLLFIVRDWSYESEIPYGNGHRLIDEVLAENSDQTIEMQELRQKIAMSFHEIGGFLLPTPGNIVVYSDSVNFTGDVQQVSPQFKKFVKELTLALFAPENLIIKQINGEKIRARDVSQYLQAYTNIFNGNALPKPKSILMATAETSNSIFCDDCLRHYSDKMEQTLEAVDSYMTENELIELHEKTKNETLAQFLEKPTLGGNKFRNTFQDKIKNGTEQRFLLIKGHNERKLKDFIERANLHNDRIGSELLASVQKRILDEIESSSPELSYSKLYDVLQSAVQDALSDVCCTFYF